MEEPKNDVPSESSPDGSEPVITQSQPSEVPGSLPDVPATLPKGAKTPETNLYAALEEERRLRKQAEQRALEAEDKLNNPIPTPSDDIFSEEGKALKNEIDSLKSEISEVKGELTKERLIASNPIFKDKWNEFEAFRSNPENKGMNMRTSAKAFLVENGLLEAPTRIGLESTTGGTRTPTVSGMTTQEVEALRKNDFKRYQKLLISGKLKIVDR